MVPYLPKVGRLGCHSRKYRTDTDMSSSPPDGPEESPGRGHDDAEGCRHEEEDAGDQAEVSS